MFSIPNKCLNKKVPMYNNYSLFGLCLLYACLALAHYPDGDGPKPCAQRHNIIAFRGLICVPNGDNGFEPTSVDNCESKLKAECPEFNQANCEWYPYACSGQPALQLPVCKLRYKANSGLKDKTWMEIMYTNQYGTHPNETVGLPTIVEIHRYNYKFANFGLVENEDWPKSVPDSNAAAGIRWSEPIQLAEVNQVQGLCYEEGVDSNGYCSVTMRKYAYGYIAPTYVPRDSDTVRSVCMKDILNPTVSLYPDNVCWLKFIRTDPQTGYTFTVMEVQFYNNRSHPRNPTIGNGPQPSPTKQPAGEPPAQGTRPVHVRWKEYKP